LFSRPFSGGMSSAWSSKSTLLTTFFLRLSEMGGSGTLHSWSLKGGAKLLKGRPRRGSMKIHHQARMQRCQNDAIFKQTSQTKGQRSKNTEHYLVISSFPKGLSHQSIRNCRSLPSLPARIHKPHQRFVIDLRAGLPLSEALHNKNMVL